MKLSTVNKALKKELNQQQREKGEFRPSWNGEHEPGKHTFHPRYHRVKTLKGET